MLRKLVLLELVLRELLVMLRLLLELRLAIV